jgi:predicted DNA-binding transcriptional regulator AlpA
MFAEIELVEFPDLILLGSYLCGWMESEVYKNKGV